MHEDGNIKNEVFTAIEYASTFIAFGSKHYGEDTGNSASTCKESQYVEGSACTGKRIVRIRMIPFSEQFAHIQGRTFFGMNDLEVPWMVAWAGGDLGAKAATFHHNGWPQLERHVCAIG